MRVSCRSEACSVLSARPCHTRPSAALLFKCFAIVGQPFFNRLYTMALKCPRCGKGPFSRADNFTRHVHNHDDVTEEELKEMQEAIRWEQDVAKLPDVLSDLERSAVKPGTDNKHFTCLLCEPSKELSKRSAMTHLTVAHKDRISQAEAANFVVVKDATKLRKGYTWTHFEEYFDANAVEQEPNNGGGNATESGGGEIPQNIPGVATVPGQAFPSQGFATPQQTLVVAVPAMAASSKVAGQPSELDPNSTPAEHKPAVEKNCLDIRAGSLVTEGTPAVATAADTAPVPDSSSGASVPNVAVPVGAEAAPGHGADDRVAAILSTVVEQQKKMATTLEQMQKKGECKLKAQELRVTAKALEYKLPGYCKRVPNFPLPYHHINVAPFTEWISRKADGTVRPYTEGLQKLMASVETVDGTPIDFKAFLFSCRKGNIIHKLLRTELWSTDRHWTRGMKDALTHFCEWNLNEALNADDDVTVNALRQLQCDVLKTLKSETSAAKTTSGVLKNQADAERVERTAPPSVWQDAVWKAFIDLYAIWDKFHASPTMPEKARKFANAAMVGILFFNQYAGRPGEWLKVTAEVIRDKLAERAELEPGTEPADCAHEIIILSWDKTCKKRGKVGKWLHEGTWWALDKYLGLPGKVTPWLLEPASEKGCRTTLQKGCNTMPATGTLKTFQDRYMPGYDKYDITLIRKLNTTAVHDKAYEEKAKKMVEEAERHGKGVMESAYNLKNPKKDALNNMLLYKHFVGGWPKVPTDETIKAKKRTYDEITAATKWQAESDEDEGDEAEEEPAEDGADADSDSDIEVVIGPPPEARPRVSEPIDLD